MQLKKVSVVIPAYNEEAGIKKTLIELCREIPENYTIIVVDDGSTDGTSDEVESINDARIRLIHHQYNRGYGSAIKTACRQAEGDILVWYDADGQHRPCDLIGVVNKLIDNNLDYVIGVRTSESHVEDNRRFGKKVLSWIANKLAREPMEDVNSGMRAFKKEVLLRHISLLPARFGASTVTSFLMQEMDYMGECYPITVRKREGTSTVKPIKDGLSTLKLIMNIILLFRAKEVLSMVSIDFIIIGFAYGVFRAVTENLGFPVLSAIIIISGIQIYFLGIISAQISALRLERHDIS